MCTPDTMSVYEAIANERIGNFIKNKHHILTDIVTDPSSHKQESAYIRCNPFDFIAMIDQALAAKTVSGIRVYFASYKIGFGNEYIPAGKHNLLTIIARPTMQVKDNSGNVIGEKDIPGFSFVVNEKRFINLDTIDNKIATDWINNYMTLKYPRLVAKFGSETRSIWYKIEALKTFQQDLYKVRDDGTLKNVIIFFGAYRKGEYINDDHSRVDNPNGECRQYSVSKQLTLIFLINTVDGVAAGGDTQTEDSEFKYGSSDNDTGIPCPPRICQ